MDVASESDADILWDDVVSSLEERELPAATVAMLRSCVATSLDEQCIHVATSSRFVQRTLGRLSAQLDEVASEVAFQPLHVIVDVGRAPERKPASVPEPAPSPVAQEPAAPVVAKPAEEEP
jgi:chromosomal replication initiator protein